MGWSAPTGRVAETAPRLEVSKRHGGDAAPVVVALRGELDAAALSLLEESFDDVLSRDDADVVIDLAGVDFIGAAWIGAFVRSRADLESQDRALTLRAPTRTVRRLLEVCDLSYLVESTRADTRHAVPFDLRPS